MLANLTQKEAMLGMTTEALARSGGEHGKTGEYRALALVSSAHFVLNADGRSNNGTGMVTIKLNTHV